MTYSSTTKDSDVPAPPTMEQASCSATRDSEDPISPTDEQSMAVPIISPQAEQGPNTGKNLFDYLPLYRAVLKGDLKTTEEILDQDPDAIKQTFNTKLDTILHIAVGTKKAISVVAKLVELMPKDIIFQKNLLGHSVLHIAAFNGNLGAAKTLIETHPDLLYVLNKGDKFPIELAAIAGHRDILEFLESETKSDVEPNPCTGLYGVRLLTAVIDAEHFDFALYLVKKYPKVVEMRSEQKYSGLERLATKDSAFRSNARFNFWQRLIYSCVLLDNGAEIQHITSCANDVEDPTCGSTIALGGLHFVVHKWYANFCEFLKQLVPIIKDIHDNKLKHQQAVELVKCLCKDMEASRGKDVIRSAASAMLMAVKLDIIEIVEIIVEAFPETIFYSTEGQGFFHLAIANRCEKVYNVISLMSGHEHHFLGLCDSDNNTLLHTASRLAPPYKLNLVSSAALQMQREIQWFKEIEKIVHPWAKLSTNRDGKKPNMIFTEEHEKLKVDGEKWMKDTATSFTIAAALIITVVFAAAITVPGGNNGDNGFPIFSEFSAFIIFAVSDVVSLFTSSTSLLMFLSILTSRYAEEDFLHALPRRLCIGLVTLFVSILFMMIAFSATVYMVFGQQKTWVLVPVAALAFLSVGSFVLLQFPLLVDVVSSTYGRGIFGKQSDRPFY